MTTQPLNGGKHLKVLTWNLEWATSNSARAAGITRRLSNEAADIAVLTEAQLPFVRQLFEHVVDAGPHPKSNKPNGSKVVIASPHPFTIVDRVGSPDLPPNNFLCVDTETDHATVRIIGVVIRYNQKREYLDALGPVLDRLVTDRTVLAGDFNLRMTGTTPLERQLQAILHRHAMTTPTARAWPALADELPLIDHISVSPGLRATDTQVWSRHDPKTGLRLTDHAGASTVIRIAP